MVAVFLGEATPRVLGVALLFGDLERRLLETSSLGGLAREGSGEKRILEPLDVN